MTAAKKQHWLSVTTTDLYGRWETLGAQVPQSGEPFRNEREKHLTPLRVRWPNGTITRQSLLVVHGHDTAQLDIFDTQELFISVTVRGLKIKIPLRELRFQVM